PTRTLYKSSPPSNLSAFRGRGSLASSSICFITRMIVDLGSERRSFSTEGFGTTLNEAIFFQSPLQFLKTNRFLVAPLSDYGEIVQILHQPLILLEREEYCRPSTFCINYVLFTSSHSITLSNFLLFQNPRNKDVELHSFGHRNSQGRQCRRQLSARVVSHANQHAALG